MLKKELVTTLSLLKKAAACQSGLDTLIKSLPKDYPEDKEINLLHILESNGIDHFFWAWRATTKPEKKVKRLILHDIIQLVEPIYLKQYPKSNLFKQVLEALKTGKGLLEAKKIASEASYATNAAKHAADAAVSAAKYAASEANAAMYAAYAAEYVSDVSYEAMYAAKHAAYAAVSADSAAKYAASEANAAMYAAYAADAAVNDVDDIDAAKYAADAAVSAANAAKHAADAVYAAEYATNAAKYEADAAEYAANAAKYAVYVAEYADTNEANATITTTTCVFDMSTFSSCKKQMQDCQIEIIKKYLK